MLGYNSALGAAQPADVTMRMRYLVPGLYLGAYIVMLIGLGLVYNLDVKTLAKMNAKLDERRAKNAAK